MEENDVKRSTKLIVIGGSAGSLDIILQLLPLLKEGFEIPVIIVLHRKTVIDSVLTDLLATRTPIPVREIEEKEPVLPGVIYLVPADYHLLIEQERTFSLDDSERVNYSRPSIDVVFQSAAEVYGPDLVCILLSGANADGTEGFRYARERGSVTIAQDPGTAEVRYMPEQAILAGVADFVLDIQSMASFVNAL